MYLQFSCYKKYGEEKKVSGFGEETKSLRHYAFLLYRTKNDPINIVAGNLIENWSWTLFYFNMFRRFYRNMMKHSKVSSGTSHPSVYSPQTCSDADDDHTLFQALLSSKL